MAAIGETHPPTPSIAFYSLVDIADSSRDIEKYLSLKGSCGGRWKRCIGSECRIEPAEKRVLIDVRQTATTDGIVEDEDLNSDRILCKREECLRRTCLEQARSNSHQRWTSGRSAAVRRRPGLVPNGSSQHRSYLL